MGFVDLHGGYGRRFGSLGLTLAALSTRLTVRPSYRLSVLGAERERATAFAAMMLERHALAGAVQVEVEEAIPVHAGLGSGTQLALAVTAGIAELFGIEWSPGELAALSDRGLRSGVGVGAFEQGGFIVDGGRGADTRTPPVIARLPFPDDWRVLLVFDAERQGLSGASERSAFDGLAPMPAEIAAEMCRRVLMQLLPALAEREFAPFSAGIAVIQQLVGDCFAPYQGGRYSSPHVASVLAWLRAEGLAGVGQSSWGPTGFALFETEAEAQRLAEAARQRWRQEPALSFMISKARNRGADFAIMNHVVTEAAASRRA
jgi:beta-RFAP synthase